ncbi:hypothetical protein LRR81_07415 [Metabacillus sp. GX 13764]|uniref:hypothetical protein n=1 Tax=Metabacillus kandeliae TaxID=2900151 RepID=UPI001E494FC0|nr:hypothetical protein [Metabacillus kandeliae]MCD7034063.1 hypothetical protein [Metabacillus kandeliae]
MKAPIPQYEEDLVYEYIYRVYLIDELERHRLYFEKMHFKIPEPYMDFIDVRLKVLRNEVRSMKLEMRQLKIKVLDPETDGIFSEYKYFAHGYEASFRFWEAAMRLEGTRRLTSYFFTGK